MTNCTYRILKSIEADSLSLQIIRNIPNIICQDDLPVLILQCLNYLVRLLVINLALFNTALWLC